MRASTPKLDNLITVRRAIQRLAGGPLDEGGTPEFGSVKLTNLTASRLVYTDTSKVLASVTNLASWIAGTTNRVTVSNDGDGSVTLTGPQDIHTGASPIFAGLTLTGFSGVIKTATGVFAGGATLDDVAEGTNYKRVPAATYTDLTDSGDSTLHYHVADRARANHTGTQLLATISDHDLAAHTALGLFDASSDVDHDQTTNFVADEHIAHSGVTLTAGVGLSGGGDISAGRTFNIDITELTADATPNGAADYVMTYDADAEAHKKVLIDNLPTSSDSDAIHDNVAGEIAAVTEKATPADADVLLIEDSEAANVKKKVQIANLPSGGSGSTITLRENNHATNYDFTVSDFTTDGTWRDKDLSSILPAGTTKFWCRIVLNDDLVASVFGFRKNGNTGVSDGHFGSTEVANLNAYDDLGPIGVDANRVCEYYGVNRTFTTINVVITAYST